MTIICMGYALRTGKIKNAYRILDRGHKRKKSPWEIWNRWQNDIKVGREVTGNNTNELRMGSNGGVFFYEYCSTCYVAYFFGNQQLFGRSHQWCWFILILWGWFNIMSNLASLFYRNCTLEFNVIEWLANYLLGLFVYERFLILLIWFISYLLTCSLEC
jgi:hypothetical protein